MLGMSSYFNDITIDGTQILDSFIDFDDLFEPLQNATKIGDVGCSDLIGVDISNRYLPVAGGSPLTQNSKLSNSVGTDFKDIFAAKGTGLTSSYTVTGNYSTIGVAGASLVTMTIDIVTPRDHSEYTFVWGTITYGGVLSDSYVVSADNSKYYMSSVIEAFNSRGGTIQVTITDNTTGESLNDTISFTFANQGP